MDDYSSWTEQPWYSDSASVKNVIIGNEITSVGKYAFRNCSAIETVVIGDAVTHINSYAFQYCRAMQSVVIGS